jgi:hypothetical protein
MFFKDGRRVQKTNPISSVAVRLYKLSSAVGLQLQVAAVRMNATHLGRSKFTSIATCSTVCPAGGLWHHLQRPHRCCHTAAVSQADASSQKQCHRFYAPQLPPAAGLSIELDPEEAKHAVRVLRLQAG